MNLPDHWWITIPFRNVRQWHRRKQLERMVEYFVNQANRLGAEDLGKLVWISSLNWANGNAENAYTALLQATSARLQAEAIAKGESPRGLPRLR
jgi:hypothetical protein